MCCTSDAVWAGNPHTLRQDKQRVKTATQITRRVEERVFGLRQRLTLARFPRLKSETRQKVESHCLTNK
jgi:hypothetical protein